MSQDDATVSTTVESPKVRHITPPVEELQSLPSAFYNCEICGLQVKTQSNLRAHYIKTHGLVNDAKDIAFLLRKKTDISDVFHCPVSNCKYTKATGSGFSKFWHLKQHYQLVHMKKTLQCATCSQRFSTPNALIYHSKTCGTNYECPICGRKYKAKKFLNQHARRSGHDIRGQFAHHNNQQQTSNSMELGSSPASTSLSVTPSNPSTSLAILPLLILPLGMPYGNDETQIISNSTFTSTAVSLVGDFISQLGSNLTVLPPIVSTGSGSGFINMPLSAHSSFQLSHQQQYAPSTSQSSTYAQPQCVNVGTSQGMRFAPLVDVGTATMRHSHAHTQTEVNVPPDYICSPIPVPAAQQTEFCYYNNNQQCRVQMTRDSFTATSPPQMSVGNSPPPANFLPDMSHTSTYMSPGHSIELQYPEMNSNSTMTTYHQQHLQQHAFQQTTSIPTSSVSAATGGGSGLYHHSENNSSIGCYDDYSGPSSLSYGNEWRNIRRHDGQSLNSVAVETTFDLANFDASNSGNCYWPSAENFSHTETQTVCDAAALEQWFSADVQTQTSRNRSVVSRQQQSSWADSGSGVCVGVNTEMLMTPDHEANSP